ncbi:hypothetical protein [Thermonema rossianum]|uniref:hypothetical protein n=1 Tax=Thermonema rossianum TaxID=55505 RepID=UPI000571AF44|nr:hypothetical protein [Thermonema rossianum]
MIKKAVTLCIFALLLVCLFACEVSFDRVTKVATLRVLRANPRDISLRGALVDVSPGDTIVEYGFLLSIDNDPAAVTPDTVLRLAQGSFVEPALFSKNFPVAALIDAEEKAMIARAYAVKSSGELLLGEPEAYVLSFGFVNNVNLTATSLSFDMVLFFGDSCTNYVTDLVGVRYGVLLGSRREVTLQNALDRQEFQMGSNVLTACANATPIVNQVVFDGLQPGALYFLRFYWIGPLGVVHYGESYPFVTLEQ